MIKILVFNAVEPCDLVSVPFLQHAGVNTDRNFNTYKMFMESEVLLFHYFYKVLSGILACFSWVANSKSCSLFCMNVNLLIVKIIETEIKIIAYTNYFEISHMVAIRSSNRIVHYI
jgi:hypothetical protein